MRQLSVPYLNDGQWFTQGWLEKDYDAYLYWTPSDDIAISANLIFERFENNLKSGFLSQVDTLLLPIAIRYFDDSGFFADGGVSFVRQNVDRRFVIRGEDSTNMDEGTQRYFILNAGLGYRLPYRRGLVGIEGVNLTNERFRFQDENFRSSATSFPSNAVAGTFFPEHGFIAYLNLNF
jgi:hypothetical protein